jgi:photosystem II stability/assembly factor-like uncharacterized protein/methionine-rich copper-binding protein CopC
MQTMATRTSKMPPFNRTVALVFILAALLLASAVTGYAGVNEWVTNGTSGTIVNSLGIAPNYATSKTVFAGTDSAIYKSTSGGTSWTQSGLVGIHIRSLAVSPVFASDNTVFSGTNSAGVYKSTDGGTSWTQAGLAGTGISALAISHNYATDRTVFAGTDGGIYKSTDAGTSWTAMNTGFSHGYINSIKISPDYAADNTVFAGTSGGGVYKTGNGGANWEQKNTGMGNANISSLGVSPNYAADGTVFAGTRDGGGVYKSVDGGANWVQSGLVGVNIFSLDTSPNYAADSSIVVGTYGNSAHISTNGGTSWTQINSGLTPTNIPSVRFSPAYSSDYTIFAGTWGNGVYSCTTSDSLPPVISSVDPVNGATAIARDKTITITFNENVQSGIAYNLITLKDAANNQVAMTKAIDERKLTLDPTADLAYGATYTVIIPAGAVKDTANNSFGAQHTLSFTTTAAPDTTAPTVSSADPVNSATNVIRDKTVVITFNENIQAGSAYANITFKTAAGVSVDATPTISGATTLSFDPPNDLAGNTVYTITIPVSAVKDMSNNNLAAQYTLSFTTQNDTTPPTVSSADPANNAVDVAKEKTITITFNENILAGTAYETIAVRDTSSTAISLSKSIKDKVLTLDPTKDLTLGMKYTVTIPASGVKDSAGNALAATYSFSLTTQSDTNTANAPQGLKLASNQGLAHISWTSITDSNLSSYNVYRKIKGETTLVKINTAALLEAQYQDKSIEIDKTYVYAVTWVDKTAKESAKSSELEVTIEKTANQSGFADVPDTAWYKDYVILLTTNSIVSGYVDGSFRPNHNVSRGEFAKMMCLAMGWTLENPSSASFTDVPNDHWAFNYIETAKSQNVIAGYEDGTFRPGKSITRAEIAKIASETLALPAGTSTLTDIASSWAKDFIAKCVKANIVGGYNDNTFRPSNTASRAEAAKMVVGVLSANE